MLALLFASTTFGGGGSGALTTALAEATQRPVVISTSTGIQLKSFEFDASTVGALAAGFRKQPITFQPGSDIVLSDQAYVRGHFPIQLSGPMALNMGLAPAESLSSGKVTLSTAGKPPISVKSLESLHWAKPFQVNYLLQDLALNIEVKDLPEAKFLDLVKKAVGADWLDVNGVLMLYPSPMSLRIRVPITFSRSEYRLELMPGKGGSLVPNVMEEKLLARRRALFLAGIQEMSDDELLRLFEAPSGRVTVSIVPGGMLGESALSYVQAQADVESSLASDRPHPATSILANIDQRRPASVVISADGQIQLKVPIIDPATRKESSVVLN